LAAGEIGFESDTGKIKIGTGSTAWNALTYTASSTAVTYLFNATGGQTTFSGTDANGLTLAYTVGSEQVYLNGVLQVRGSDYTATNGTSIVLASGALVSDVLNVIAFSALSLSDTYTQAQADAKFFQTANAFLAGKNKIINGDFYINQRSFTSSTTSGTYGFDRWLFTNAGGTGTYSAQTFTIGAAPVAGYEGKNFASLQTTGQSAAGDVTILRQYIEDVRTFAGQTVTLSFWAKSASGTPKVAVELFQEFGVGGSTGVNIYAGQVTLSTSWARYSVTVAFPSISGKTIGTAGESLRVNLFVSAGSNFDARTGSLGIQTNTFSFWGVQLEAGSIATPFQTATGTIQGELAACKYYYDKRGGQAGTGTILNNALSNSAGTNAAFSFPILMRVAPTAVEFSNLRLSDTSSGFTVSSVTLTNCTPTTGNVNVATTGMTGFRSCYLDSSATGNFIAFSAEL
jgi:hypothetical protein